MIELSIISADIKRKKVDYAIAEEEAKKKAYEALRGQRIAKLTELLFNEAKAKIEKTTMYYSCEVLVDEHIYTKWGKPDLYELSETAKVVRVLLQNGGYDVNEWHEYSPSWRTRSGNIGYLWISWYKC